MRKVFCDACGAEMEDTDKKTVTVMGNLDLCEGCGKRLVALDLRETVLAALRQPAPPETAEPPAFPGRGGRERARIFQALAQYHRRNGPGCLPELALRAGVEVEQLMKMEEKGKLDLKVWRKVGLALGVEAQGNA